MLTQFLYRPHIAADDMVVTPDLALERLVVVRDAARHAVPIGRLATGSIVQFADAAAIVHPAIAFVAGAYGDLAVPAAAIVPQVGVPGIDIALSRQAWRLKDVAENLEVGWCDAGSVAARAPQSALAPGSIEIVLFRDTRSAGPYRYAIRLAAREREIVYRFELEQAG